MRTRSTLTGADPVKDPVLRLSNAPVAVSGQLKDGGTSLSGDVVAMAWPNAEQLNALPEGANVPLLAVAHARTGTDGRYDLRIDPAAVPSGYRSADGQIDLDVTAAGGQSQLTWSLSLRDVGGRAWIAANASEVDAVVAPVLNMNVADGAVAVSSVQYEDTTGMATYKAATEARTPYVDAAIAQVDTSGSSAAATSGAAPMSICGPPSKGGLTYGVPARMLKAQGLSNVPVTVDFDSGASYTLGIAIKSTSGHMSTGGSQTISTGAGATNTWSSTRAIYNKYNYRAYTNSCAGSKTYRPESVHSYMTSAVSTSRTDYPTCTYYSSGTYWKQAGKNFTQNGGVAFPGIALDAQSGFNSKVKIAWKFNSRARLCGSSSLGWASSSWAGARPA